MRVITIGAEEYTLNLNMSALRRLDILRPGQDMARLTALMETTVGLLDLAQVASGKDREKLAENLLRHLDVVAVLKRAILEEIAESMRSELAKGKENGVVDLTLEELKINEKDGGLSYRRLVSLGLASGLTLADMPPLSPGMVCDLFLYRQMYDDQQHGIKRKQPKVYDA